MSILGRTAERPQPIAPILATAGKSPRHLHIHVATEEADNWIRDEAYCHGLGALHQPLVIGGAYLLVVSPLYPDVKQVEAWINSQGQGEAPQPEGQEEAAA